MIEPTDASKCDERRVKNKPDSLTHKRKGETRTMFNKDMKTWKFSAFFVISLMLMAGLFSSEALAQSADVTVEVRPLVVKINTAINSVMVTYKVKTEITGENTITIALPAGWGASMGDFGSTLAVIGMPADQTEGVWYSKTSEEQATESYVKLVAEFKKDDTTQITTAPTVTVAGVVTVVVDTSMSMDDKITVTYNRVMVQDLNPSNTDNLAEIVESLAAKGHKEYVQVDETAPEAFGYDDPAGDDRAADLTAKNQKILDMVAINVTLPEVKVTARPNAVTAEAEVDEVIVTYNVRDKVSKANTVVISLPTLWVATMDDAGAVDDFGDTLTEMKTDQTEGVWYSKTSAERATESYVKLVAVFKDADTVISATAPVVTAAGEVTVVVDDHMSVNDRIIVTYNRVMVRKLESSDAVMDMIDVADSIIGAYNVSITVRPPTQSKVTVTPTSVDAGDTDDFTVIYEVGADKVFKDNTIEIGLPSNWTPAKPASSSEATETAKSFGDKVLAKAPPGMKRTSTSYVVLEYKFKEDDMTMITGHNPTPTAAQIAAGASSAFLDVDFPTFNAFLTIPVTGGMVKGDKITVTFHNVMIELLEQTEIEKTFFTVSDLISGSDYASSTMIEVIPPKLGNVTVTPDAVTAEAIEKLTVRYAATKVLADADTYGRIRVKLPADWGPDDIEDIHLKRPVGAPDATYLSLAKSSGVTVPKSAGQDAALSVGGSKSGGWMINIDVDKMTTRHQVTLTVHNLKIDELTAPRTKRYTDLTAAMTVDKVQVTVSSSNYSSASLRGSGAPTHSPKTVRPKITKADGGSDTQPTIKVNRKTSGEVTVAPASVTAGSKQDFTITYKATEALNGTEDADGNSQDADVIEIKLPAGWAAPTAYNFNDANQLEAYDGTLRAAALKTAKAANKSHLHAYLSGSATRLAGARIRVIDGDDGGDATAGDSHSNGWIVQITLGTNGASKNSTVVLKYNDVTVQRSLAKDPKLVIETFSGPSLADGYPQFPVAKLAEDTIEVKQAADGSGVVTFMYEGNNVTSMKGKDHAGDALLSNTNASIPAVLTKDDLRELVVIYTPAGDMGAGEFEFRLPSDWSAEDVRASRGEKGGSGNTTVTVDFDAHFGEADGDFVEITFADITVPNDHGELGFTAKSKSAGGSLRQLSPRPMAFVGNAEATHDTVAVKITPEAAYENWDDVDFEIELTNAGPMHDSEIQITVPEGLSGLQTEKAAEANYVKMISTSARSVRLSTLDIIDEDIVVSTGKLNADGRIRVRFDNVDLENASTDAATGFRVATRTRGSGAPEKDDDDEDLDYTSLEDARAEYMYIQKEDGGRSIAGGLIRTINGSGTMKVEPLTVEQNSRNETIKLTYTAATDFDKKDLVIGMPSVIEADLQETISSGEGYVSTTTSRFHADIKAADRLKISGSTITWTGVKLRKGQTFITLVRRVDFLEYTGDFRWETSLGGVSLLDDDNPAMVVVGTTEDDIAFEVIENGGVAVLTPNYPASSKQSIRLRFTAENTAIQSGGRLSFSVPVGWSLPSLTDKADKATVSIVTLNDDDEEIFVKRLPKTGDAEAGSKMVLSVSGRSVHLTMGAKGGLAEDKYVTIRYGTADLKKFPVQISSVATVDEDDEDGLAIRGHFRVSADFRQRDAGTIWVDIKNVVEGSGIVAFSTSPPTVRAGSTNNTVTIVYTGEGTMDGGAVLLTIPDDWGAMQDDPLKPNHIAVEVSGTGAALAGDPEMVGGEGMMIQANLKTFGKGHKLTFTYGGGTGARENRGATAQAEIGDATFMLESKGGSDGDLAEITDEDSLKALTITVKGAESGTGEAEVEIVENKAGEGLYDGETDADNAIRQIHAGDDSTYIVFTYTPSQTIAEGQLRFTVPGTWTPPQNDATGDPGYTFFEEVGGAIISSEEFDKNTQSVTADVSLTLADQVKIHYGAEGGGAKAPKNVPTGGYSHFAIAVKGTVEDNVAFENIDDDDLAVRVRVQRSGGGMAEVSPMSVNAGDAMSAITVTYTADGEVDDGQLRLTIPANWDAPTADNVTVKAMGSSAAAVGAAMHGAGRASTALPEGLGAMDVIVDDVALAGGDMVVFTYTSAMAQGTMGTANFAVAIDGGDGPGTGVAAVGGMTTVTVGEAAPGSGTATAMTDGIVLPGSTENTLTFTYNVAGEASYPSDVRVAVPDDWTAPTGSNYTVAHKRAGRTRLGMVEKKAPVDGAMVARVVSGETVLGGDEIIFEFMDVTAPAASKSYEFQVEFRGQAIAAHPMVLVQNAAASKLVIKAPAKISADAGAAPVAITIMIQDAAGGAAAVAADVTVNLVSTNSTGSFTVSGEAVTMVTIPAGQTSAMVYYSDSRVGSTATILASDASGGLDTATTTTEVSTDVDAVSSVTVSPTVAKAGDTVTVSAKGTPGRTVMFSVDSMPATVTNSSMIEGPSGSYSGSFMVVANQHGDGDYTVTVNLNAESDTASLTIDSTAPTVSASASPVTVGNGGTVTITAMVDGATSVMADVAALDSTKTDVTLTMANGSYSASVTISDGNEAVNGSKTITVTAMDAAGNSAMAEAMVTLDNKMSFTSTIPAGMSLFHVPLDQEGLDTVGNLKAMLGDAAGLVIVSEGGSWNSRSDDVMITADLGLVLVMNAAKTVTFEGDAWGGGTSMITLAAGSNLIGLPVNDSRVTNVSDIMGLFASGVVGSIIVSVDGDFQAVTAAGASGDGPVMGDAAYLVTATTAGTAAVLGKGWTNGGTTGAAPIALAGYQVEGQTPVLDVHGSVVDEITGLAKEGFRVKVKNLSTKASLNKVTSAETAEGYNMTFVDLKVGNAARIGDVLEISADSPNPLIGIKPVRHIVTVDDVKNSRIQLEDLIAYEIPAETELLRNYPNPFNPETWIPYHLSEDADVKLTIYDISGEVVRDIDVGHQTAAKYDTRAKAIYWDGRNRFGEQVASGIYFYHLRCR